MNDRDFDQLLCHEAPQLPFAQVPPPPEPWRHALILVCLGLALTTITLNGTPLQYILPVIGSLLVYLGFRSLRRENSWLRGCHVLSILLLLYGAVYDILLATPVPSHWSAQTNNLLGLAGWLLTLILLFALWQGLKKVFQKAGQKPKTAAAGAVVLCYTVFFLLALVSAEGPMLWPLLILWVCLLAGLFRVSRSLEQAGYALSPAPVRLSGLWLGVLYLGGLLAAVLACLFLFSRYPMEATPVQAETGQETLRAELVELGFPEELLADLPDEEVALLDGASHVQLTYNGGNLNPYDPNFHDLNQLYYQSVQVTLPGENTLRIFVFFQFRSPLKHAYMDGLEILPNVETELGLQLETPRGLLLWEAGGQELQMKLISEPARFHTSTYAVGPISSTATYRYHDMLFSLPRESANLRGYVTWGVSGFSTETYFNYLITYIHQVSPFFYPWATPCQAERKNPGGAFVSRYLGSDVPAHYPGQDSP